jgi:hypothetical protein
MKPEEQKTVEQQITSLLDQRAEELDGQTLSRLRQARSRALEQGPPIWKRFPRASDWVLTGGFATATVALLAVTLWFDGAGEEMIPPVSAGDLEILASGEDLELYDQLEFYRWLEEQELDPSTDTNGKA